jgi:hypothetical protein
MTTPIRDALALSLVFAAMIWCLYVGTAAEGILQ